MTCLAPISNDFWDLMAVKLVSATRVEMDVIVFNEVQQVHSDRIFGTSKLAASH